jgi:hypothetical protein
MRLVAGTAGAGLARAFASGGVRDIIDHGHRVVGETLVAAAEHADVDGGRDAVALVTGSAMLLALLNFLPALS